ncbi:MULTISPECIES: 4-hydroxybenzoate 3-monooxygenase [unclassified Lysobacter]|uniref:4-hydroxybenzoate 3-monooxygenase n=1 Tax=unclassified Lysobacter TaxID=2635362 RepID=UPI001BE7B17C|nr:MULTISPECIES: 4-hydroxybenzoate 3-monooxygenase [unclassified Lysobacter]MBT2748855.1 4-hydroxybenzoate 3-monooxygenase [Lysobacter sp. ISL-42]MBT2751098.1 4-hydroxybenzoate 3-monooxygenase [Lysobacter sp. ISL-50]MBT2779644.1 4-hydroxybenzoate 3-monooxygenase [Lysobacter sp. ISL-54]MBT2783414.1 4-hydroxybenzoate 3-monooxygenase [Lysobacter sp. ISL-52]
MRTQVAILGAGPAGLLLAHLLHRQGISSIVLERRTREYVEHRIRAGVLEQGTVDLLCEAGVGARMEREGLRHEGIELLVDGQRHRIDLREHTEGRGVMVYGQHEVVKDLIAARIDSGQPLLFQAEATRLQGLDSAAPSVHFRHDDADHRIDCDYVIGCDGFHGISRGSVPDGVLSVFERVYPFAWLGVLAQVPPANEELIYAHHPNGFALFSMRSPQITRLYLQCSPDEDLAQWPDQRIWDELDTRLSCKDGWRVARGPILHKSITPMRSFVTEPMQYGRLFLAGDAAHIVPPTGAKGMNLAVADVRTLAAALTAHYRDGDDQALAGYSSACIKRVWRAEHFSWWMTSMLHRNDANTPFMNRLQRSELDYVIASPAATRTLAENYVGMPWR